MTQINFEIDFQGVTGKIDLFKRFVKIFGLPEGKDWIFGNWNWDGFTDRFTSLGSDSATINSIQPVPEKVHLVVKNIEEVKKVSQKDYDILLSVLETSTQKEYRGDKIKFSYQIV